MVTGVHTWLFKDGSEEEAVVRQGGTIPELNILDVGAKVRQAGFRPVW